MQYGKQIQFELVCTLSMILDIHLQITEVTECKITTLRILLTAADIFNN